MAVAKLRFISSGEIITQGRVLAVSAPVAGSSFTRKTANRSITKPIPPRRTGWKTPERTRVHRQVSDGGERIYSTPLAPCVAAATTSPRRKVELPIRTASDSGPVPVSPLSRRHCGPPRLQSQCRSPNSENRPPTRDNARAFRSVLLQQLPLPVHQFIFVS